MKRSTKTSLAKQIGRTLGATGPQVVSTLKCQIRDLELAASRFLTLFSFAQAREDAEETAFYRALAQNATCKLAKKRAHLREYGHIA
jgi:hypothetical protein